MKTVLIVAVVGALALGVTLAYEQATAAPPDHVDAVQLTDGVVMLAIGPQATDEEVLRILHEARNAPQ